MWLPVATIWHARGGHQGIEEQPQRIRASGGGWRDGSRDRPRSVVAELGPPEPGRAVDVSDALLADVVRRGWLRPPIVPSQVLPARKPVAPLADLLQNSTRIAAIDDYIDTSVALAELLAEDRRPATTSGVRRSYRAGSSSTRSGHG